MWSWITLSDGSIGWRCSHSPKHYDEQISTRSLKHWHSSQVNFSSQWTFLKWMIFTTSLCPRVHSNSLENNLPSVTLSFIHITLGILAFFHLTKSQRAHNYRMIRTWNSSPSHIRACKTITTFKNKLKENLTDFAILSK